MPGSAEPDVDTARPAADGAPKTRQQWLQDLTQAAWRQGQIALAAGDTNGVYDVFVRDQFGDTASQPR